MTRTQFVEEVFYPEVYGLGTLCVGFNLLFDLSHTAIHAGSGRGHNANAFSLLLSRRIRWPRIRVQPSSPGASFISFAPKKHMAKWETPFFKGRFLDLNTAASALSGEQRLSLEKACNIFHTADRKTETESLGRITEESLQYCRNDVIITWQLFEKVWAEYSRHPFASDLNEREMQPHSMPITRMYSGASIAKAYFVLMGIRGLFEKQPDISPHLLGIAASSYYGGRAEVRVRCLDVPVTVLDFTSMYPSVFILQNLQELMCAARLSTRDATESVREFMSRVSLDDVYDPATWTLLRHIVRIKPNGAILPVRMRHAPNEAFGIAITPLHSEGEQWYALADIISAKLLGQRMPEILEAIEIVPEGQDPDLRPVMMRGSVRLNPRTQIFKTVVEERQRIKQMCGTDVELKGNALALKILANSGAYGIFYEINEMLEPCDKEITAYAETSFLVVNAPNERPGKYCNPIIASFVTSGARLKLTALEANVVRMGGTYAFCDTDSLAIVTADPGHLSVPSLSAEAIEEVIRAFDSLNPYDRDIIPNLLKREQENVNCWAISAKRYVLFRRNEHGSIHVVKASESGLGGIMGRNSEERTPQLACAIWQAILDHELLSVPFPKSFDQVLRRKFPLSKPATLRRGSVSAYNHGKPYRDQIKPSNFLQMATPAISFGNELRPVAPFDYDYERSIRGRWMDLESRKSLRLDWADTGHAGAVPVVRLDQFMAEYARHPESKAATAEGTPAHSGTRGLLGRLAVYEQKRSYIGKEVNRLDTEEAWSPDNKLATEILRWNDDAQKLNEHMLQLLERLPRAEVAQVLGISIRRLQDILKRRSAPRAQLLRRIFAYCATRAPRQTATIE